MCGILGVIGGLENKKAEQIMGTLFRLSESRGRESSGIAVRAHGSISIIKLPESASHLLKAKKYHHLYSSAIEAAIGHARLVTDGSTNSSDNQPVSRDGVVVVHNGIIVNHEALWAENSDLERRARVDTEIVNTLLRKDVTSGLSPAAAIQSVFKKIKGEATLAMMFEEHLSIYLATNTGSLYICQGNGFSAFASERFILEGLGGSFSAEAAHIPAGFGCILSPDGASNLFSLKGEAPDCCERESPARIIEENSPIAIRSAASSPRVARSPAAVTHELRRCIKCILPETMPFIEFDQSGVCNYCRNYRKSMPKGVPALYEALAGKGSKYGIDCIVGLSGGRDSSYGLHILKKELGLQPIAFSYDWGMITDLGRRNQSRMCSALGIEHVWISADIRAKRANIRKNVLAWLKRPSLGTVPLFMAGDKQYFAHANQLMKRNRVSALIMCENSLERTSFKHGFCGVSYSRSDIEGYKIPVLDRLKVAAYYGKEFLTNPSYLNTSLWDTFTGFVSYYGISHPYVYLFKYIPWDEKTIEDVLLNQYDWELAPDTVSTWRIGDGTAPFYNYIYYTVAGFTENDTFRSNQIREGQISRDEALRLAERDNAPRWDSMQWYFDTIGIDGNEALRVINRMPKLYKR